MRPYGDGAGTVVSVGGSERADPPTVVLVTSRSFGSGRADPEHALAEGGYTAVRARPDHDLGELRPALERAVGWIAGTCPITADHLDLAPALRIIARYGTGVDGISLDDAARRGVVVTNTPGANSAAVADHTLALMLAALRHVVAGDRSVRAGEALPPRGHELGALTVGLVGFGTVGQAVARRLRGFGSRVLVHDPYAPRQVLDACTAESAHDLAELFAASDVVSLHRPGGEVVVDATLLARLPYGAVLVNTARSDLVDDSDAARALRSGRLCTLATDVLTDVQSPLLSAPGVIATPHIAAQTEQAIDRMGEQAVAEILRVLRDEPALYPAVPGAGR